MAAKTNIPVSIKVTKALVMDRYLGFYIKAYLTNKNRPKAEGLDRATAERNDAPPGQTRGIDYHSIMEPGTITLHGFLRRTYHEESDALPEQTPTDQVVAKLTRVIHLATARYSSQASEDVIAHRMMFSVNSQISQTWREHGVDVDLTLR